MNPIEMAFAKLKTLLRQAPERTRDGLWRRIGALLDQFTQMNASTISVPQVTQGLGQRNQRVRDIATNQNHQNLKDSANFDGFCGCDNKDYRA